MTDTTEGQDRSGSKKGQLAPVALFIFRRPEHTRRTIEALLKCPGVEDSPIHVYCDGPRNGGERGDVDAARDVARRLLAHRAQFVESEVNRGLATSIIGGVTELCERYGRVIVLEDDLLVSPSFLSYMNAALEKYADVQSVMQIAGFVFRDAKSSSVSAEAFFLPLTTSWGWGTWKRAWSLFDYRSDGWERLFRDRTLRMRFNLDGTYDYADLLSKQVEGLVDSWAIRWYWTVFTKDGLVLYPPVSLVKNIGFDGSGSHGRWGAKGWSSPDICAVTIKPILPDAIVVSSSRLMEARRVIAGSGLIRFLRSMTRLRKRRIRLP